MLGGRHLRFEVGTDKAINVWDYEGLEHGEMPDEVQVGFVVGDLTQMARVPAGDALAEDRLTTMVNGVYRNEAPRNRAGMPKCEPTLSHLVDYLSNWPFKGASANRAEELKLALGQFCGHSFLDAPTYPEFAGGSPIAVYELDSLENSRSEHANLSPNALRQECCALSASSTKIEIASITLGSALQRQASETRIER